jgi:hypothetical protein
VEILHASINPHLLERRIWGSAAQRRDGDYGAKVGGIVASENTWLGGLQHAIIRWRDFDVP